MARGRVTDKDNGFKDFVGTFRTFDGYRVSAGVHAEEANQTHKPSKLPIGAISVIHEFGSPAANVPERPHIRAAFDAHVRRYVRAIIHASSSALRKRRGPKAAYQKVADGMRDDIEAVMRAGIAGNPGGKVMTVIDTEDYLNHITGKARK